MTRNDTGICNQGGLQAPRFQTLVGWGSHEVQLWWLSRVANAFFSPAQLLSQSTNSGTNHVPGKAAEIHLWKVGPNCARHDLFCCLHNYPRTIPTFKNPSKVRKCTWFKGAIVLGFPSMLALENVTIVSVFIVSFGEAHFCCTWKHIHAAQMAPPRRLFTPLYPKSQISISSQSTSD